MANNPIHYVINEYHRKCRKLHIHIVEITNFIPFDRVIVGQDTLFSRKRCNYANVAGTMSRLPLTVPTDEIRYPLGLRGPES